MIDSDAMKQIQKTIEILNSLNDNEKDLVLNDINSKLEPFKNDGTIKKKPNKKAAFRIEKTKIQLNKSVRVTSCPLCGSNNPNNIKKMERILKVIKDIYVNLVKRLLIPLPTM